MALSFEYKNPWSPLTKWVFRFLFIYVLLYIVLMFGGNRLLEPLLVWVGRDILQMDGRLEFFVTGSGDTTMAYVSLFIQAILTIIGATIWSLLDAKRPSYNVVFYWFTVLLRIYLIFFMFTYGFAKIYKTQFAGPSLMRLIQPLGEMSPMGLAWTYMAQSEGFNIFTGFMEVLGGLLLIPKRTQALGGLIIAGVMLQVFMMNMFYDIPVKLFSAHLMIFGLIIFFFDFKRFYNVFIVNKPTEAINYYVPTKEKLYQKIIVGVKCVALVGLVALFSFQGYSTERSYGDKREKPPLYGIWEVTTFVKDGDTLAPLTTDADRWRYLVIDRKGRAGIKMMDDQRQYIEFTPDSTLSTVLVSWPNTTLTGDLDITQKDSTHLNLKGTISEFQYDISFKAKDLSKILLINRGFHWINETPFNR